jgi:dTDP-4-amino-4,6-dideoxygalactose transaminase
MEMKVPYANLYRLNSSVKKDIDANMNSCIENSQFINGPWVEKLESMLSKRFISNVVGVGSGTAAQQLSLLACGIGPGDEVLVPSMTFFSTAETVSQVGATPVFVDCELDYYCMDVTDFANKITNKTKAVMPVDLYGQHANLKQIKAICNEHNLFLIQDSAQSFGSTHHGFPVGTFADLAIHSFYPAKNFDCMGDGGAVSGKQELVERVRQLRDHGRTEKYVHTEIGWNHRLDGLQASILCAKHQYVDKWNVERQNNAKYYNRRLGLLPVVLPKTADYNTHVYNQYAIMTEDRDDVFNYLTSKGVQAGKQFPLGCHQQPAYASSLALPGTEYVASHCLSLPIYPFIYADELNYVVDCLSEYFDSK